MLAQVGYAEAGKVDGGEAGAQELDVAQETRLAPQGMSQVAQGIEEVNGTGEKNTTRYHEDLDQGLAREGYGGQGGKKPDKEYDTCYQGGNDCVQPDV